jgi:hypothetical protein
MINETVAYLEKLQFVKHNVDGESFQLTFKVNLNFALSIVNDDEYCSLEYVFFKDGRGINSRDVFTLHEESLPDFSIESVVSAIKRVLNDFVGHNNINKLLVNMNTSEIERQSEGEQEFSVRLEQSYSRTYKVRASNDEEAKDYVDGCLALFTEADYISESSMTEIV